MIITTNTAVTLLRYYSLPSQTAARPPILHFLQPYCTPRRSLNCFQIVTLDLNPLTLFLPPPESLLDKFKHCSRPQLSTNRHRDTTNWQTSRVSFHKTTWIRCPSTRRTLSIRNTLNFRRICQTRLDPSTYQ